MRWLWSAAAIQWHILFGMVGAIFVGLCFGSKEEFQKFLPGNDWIWFLLFLVVGYPFGLFLMWLKNRDHDLEFQCEAVADLTEPEKAKARRVKWRRASLVALVAVGGAAIYCGNDGLFINGLRAEYIGYVLLGMAALGFCGVNIWYGGPIDPRFDPQNENPLELKP